MTKYTILHTVTFTSQFEEGVVQNSSSDKFWMVRDRENNSRFHLYPMSEELYSEFYSLRKEFCDRSGEPFNHGDPLRIRNSPVSVGSSNSTEEEDRAESFIRTHVNCERHSWNFNSKILTEGYFLTITKKDITNLNVEFNIVYDHYES